MKSVNVTEQNFKDMVNEGFFTHYKKHFLHELNNFCHHSCIDNLFTLPQVNPNAKVVMEDVGVRNPLNVIQHKERGLKVPYVPYWSAVIINLDSSRHRYETAGVTHGELRIAVNKNFSPCHIEIHVYHEDMPKSIMVVKPHQVKKAINLLMG